MAIFKQALYVIFVYVGYRALLLMYLMGYHKTVYRHYPGKCQQVKGTEFGGEDAQLVADGLAIISSGLRWSVSEDHPVYKDRVGQLLLLDMKEDIPVAQPLQLLTDGRFDVASFNPHGLSLFKTSQGGTLIYIINQRRYDSVVEKFSLDLSKKTATHMQTFGEGDPSFQYLNDVVVFGEDQFYFGNYASNSMKSWQIVESLFHLKSGSMGYFDGTKGHTVVSGLHRPNGITASINKKKIFVSLFEDGEIQVFDEMTRGTVEYKESIHIHTHGDNINIAEEQGEVTLYVGCLTVLWQAKIAHHNPVLEKASSQVLQIRLREGGQPPDIIELLSDDGHVISASSSALVSNSKLFVGSVHSQSVLCNMDSGRQ